MCEKQTCIWISCRIIDSGRCFIRQSTVWLELLNSRHYSRMTIGCLFLLLVLGFASAQDEGTVLCGPGTRNAGWRVAHTWSFSNLEDCCDAKVATWEVASEEEMRPYETGCTLYRRLLGRPLFQYIFPVFCAKTEDCGEKAAADQEVECCPRGVCIHKSLNGTSRCNDENVTPIDESSDYYTEDVKYAESCHARGPLFRTCLTCAENCGADQFLLTDPTKKGRDQTPLEDQKS